MPPARRMVVPPMSAGQKPPKGSPPSRCKRRAPSLPQRSRGGRPPARGMPRPRRTIRPISRRARSAKAYGFRGTSGQARRSPTRVSAESAARFVLQSIRVTGPSTISGGLTNGFVEQTGAAGVTRITNSNRVSQRWPLRLSRGLLSAIYGEVGSRMTSEGEHEHETQRANQRDSRYSAGLLRIDCDRLGKLSFGRRTSANQ